VSFVFGVRWRDLFVDMAIKSVGLVGGFDVPKSRVEMEIEMQVGQAIDRYALCGTFWTGTMMKIMRRGERLGPRRQLIHL
jgi:hypothetical protein